MIDIGDGWIISQLARTGHGDDRFAVFQSCNAQSVFTVQHPVGTPIEQVMDHARERISRKGN